jgi:hypothetical protein
MRTQSLGHDAPRNARPTPEYVEAVVVAFWGVEMSLSGHVRRGPASYTWRRTNSALNYFWLTPHIVGIKSRGGQLPWRALHSVGRVPANRKNQVRGRRGLKEWDGAEYNAVCVFFSRRARVPNMPRDAHALSRRLVSGEVRERHAPWVAPGGVEATAR